MGPSQSREQRRLQRKHRHQRNQRIQEREVVEAEEQEREEHTHQEEEEEEAPPPPSPSPQPQMSSYHSESSSTPYGYSPTAPAPRRTSSSRRTSRLSDHYRQSSHTPRGGGGGGRDSRATGGRDSRAAACYEGIDTPTLTTALAYTSNRLLAKTKSHHTFVVTGDILFSLFFRSKPMTGSVSIIQTSPLTAKQKDALISAVLRAAEKYGIAREDWMNNSAEVDMRTVVGMGKGEVDEVIAWSLGQKEIVFSGDGMTLLAVDFVYEFRRMLHVLTRALEGGGGGEDEEGETVDLDDVVELVRRLVTVEGRGRSLRRGVVEGRYQRLVFSDYAWMMVGREYERRFGEKGLKEDDEESDDEDEGDRVGDSTSVWTDCS